MFFDDARRRSFDGPDFSSPKFRMMLSEIWHEWFEALSEVAYQTHRACEFLAENGGLANARFGPFDFREAGNPFEAQAGPIDMAKLKECLQGMDPVQAARVLHAVQMIQAMEAMLNRRRARRNQAPEDAW